MKKSLEIAERREEKESNVIRETRLNKCDLSVSFTSVSSFSCAIRIVRLLFSFELALP